MKKLLMVISTLAILFSASSYAGIQIGINEPGINLQVGVQDTRGYYWDGYQWRDPMWWHQYRPVPVVIAPPPHFMPPPRPMPPPMPMPHYGPAPGPRFVPAGGPRPMPAPGHPRDFGPHSGPGGEHLHDHGGFRHPR
ncbi:DUF2502 domain-containing protein [Serratia quinivorans]|uniref:DUF2502 domain-containing protein n=1 Tax=Serratia quinivorans TaxID=137545 RepID=UPI001C44B793|nr:DUF2502 domain-containing protein [Serratia quinivorans]MBV6694023.1 DUF2502 domain-containing protein [Serratia quinivorans]